MLSGRDPDRALSSGSIWRVPLVRLCLTLIEVIGPMRYMFTGVAIRMYEGEKVIEKDVDETM